MTDSFSVIIFICISFAFSVLYPSTSRCLDTAVNQVTTRTAQLEGIYTTCIIFSSRFAVAEACCLNSLRHYLRATLSTSPFSNIHNQIPFMLTAKSRNIRYVKNLKMTEEKTARWNLFRKSHNPSVLKKTKNCEKVPLNASQSELLCEWSGCDWLRIVSSGGFGLQHRQTFPVLLLKN